MFLYQVYLCLCGNKLSEEIILNEVSLGGSPTIYIALHYQVPTIAIAVLH